MIHLSATDPHRWRPTQTRKTGYLPGNGIKPNLTETDYATRITPGSIIAWTDRKAYEVIDITERPTDLWPQHFRNEWKRFIDWRDQHILEGRDPGPMPTKATWEHRPLALIIRPADLPTAKPTHYAVRASGTFYVLPEHYSVCRLCEEIPPCHHVTTEAAIDHAMQNTERLMAIQPGCCLGCGEPINRRMKATRFPGPNLWRPDLGENSAVFHARNDCSMAVYRYREQWKAMAADDIQPTLPLDD
ncbi:hypothetical protein ACPCDX_28955 [Streptomyces koyangensis]|uniref:hypothetical protein n=1 Tax=Streptomyces koyangensis TaxID=188770 RepID=UPI003C2AC1F0